jgi:F-type H+-transporting ATPase subunit gamma
MSSLRVIRRRIRSVENTKKITRAMEMVAGAKLRRLHEELMHERPYATRLKEIAQRFLENYPDISHPLVSPLTLPSPLRGEEKGGGGPAGLLLIASDTGLCGTYNERILVLSENFLREHPSAVTIAIGKKASRFCARRGFPRAQEFLDWGGRYDPSKAQSLFRWMEERYRQGAVSSWWVIYTQFFSAVRWKPLVERLLPIERPPAKAIPEKVILEPQQQTLTEEPFPRYIQSVFTELLLASFTAEHSARMISMKNATDNASEMIDHLTLVRNKARQAAITKELIEVVSGAEALR